MASYFVTSIVEGQWFYVTDATPVATISAPRGSLAIRTDAGNESLWINTTAGGSPGTNWARVLSPNIHGDIDLTSVDQLTLLDNAAVALDSASRSAGQMKNPLAPIWIAVRSAPTDSRVSSASSVPYASSRTASSVARAGISSPTVRGVTIRSAATP